MLVPSQTSTFLIKTLTVRVLEAPQERAGGVRTMQHPVHRLNLNDHPNGVRSVFGDRPCNSVLAVPRLSQGCRSKALTI